MPITYSSQETLYTVATTAWSWTPSTALVTDEIILLIFSVNSTGFTITGPTGGSSWTYPGPNGTTAMTSGSASIVWAWHKVTAGENGTTPTYDFTGPSALLNIHALRVQGADGTNPLNVFAHRVDADATKTTPAMSTTVPNTEIFGGANQQSASAGNIISAPSGWTALQNSSEESSGRAHVLAYKGTQAASGTVATADFTATSGLAGNVWQVAFAPATGGGGGSAPGTTVHVWAGAPTKTSLRFGVKTTGVSSVRVVASTSSSLASGLIYSTTGTPSAEGCCVVEVNGLTAGTVYYYGIERGGTLDTTTIYQTKTLPSTNSFKFAHASCLQNNSTTSAIFTQMDTFAPDFFLHLGDWHYDDNSTATVASQEESISSQIVVNSALKTFISKTPTLYETSDHDAGANNFSPGPQANTPFLRTAYVNMVPSFDLPNANGLYQSFVVGRVRFIMCDTRSFRSSNAATDNSSKTMLGTTQKNWLKNELIQSEPVKVITFDCAWIGSAVAGEDDWTGFTTERTEIANYITSNGVKAVILHGDAHMLAADNGTNSAGGIPVFAAAPLHQTTSLKGGPYSQGFYPNPVGASGRQAGLVTVTDSGTAIALAFNGIDDTGTSRITLTVNYSLTGTLSRARVKVWNGSSWVISRARYYNGVGFAPARPKGYV